MRNSTSADCKSPAVSIMRKPKPHSTPICSVIRVPSTSHWFLQLDRRPHGACNGSGREDGPGRIQSKGFGPGLRDGAKDAGGGRSRGGSGGRTSGSGGKLLRKQPDKRVCVYVLALKLSRWNHLSWLV